MLGYFELQAKAQDLSFEFVPRSHGSFQKLGVPYFGALIIRILLFRVLYSGSLFSETLTCQASVENVLSRSIILFRHTATDLVLHKDGADPRGRLPIGAYIITNTIFWAGAPYYNSTFMGPQTLF